MATKMCATARPKSIAFKLFSPKAKRVSIAGSFNNWDTSKLTAKKDTKGNWVLKTSLKPGRYEYKFFVDGSWMNDPNAATVYNSYGTQNSIVEVK
ncbi:MAG: glycogen-binding domain-containing protein [Candidatus Omnitrophica bacterium]|nr:glycogen-binding domain-containing protein [Candidatus Omnitrophota bacterium]